MPLKKARAQPAKRAPAKKLQILVADDHDLVQQGLRALIDQEPGWTVCGVAESGPEAVKAALRLRPDVAIVDLDLPGLGGLEVTREIKRRVPTCEIVIFTGRRDSDAAIREAFAQGAKSYILKTEVSTHLTQAIAALAQHKPYFTAAISEILFARFTSARQPGAHDHPPGEERLSVSEQAVVRLLADGHSNASVAKQQRLSVRTVENMRAGIMTRLRLASFADLVRYAVRNGLVDG
jgi:DNA-binding NarL/FixJ family response regulator